MRLGMAGSLSHVGEPALGWDAYLVKGQTAKGAPVYRINDTCDLRAGDDDPALVLRTADGCAETWKPVEDIAQLRDFLKAATTEERRERLGLWIDRSNLFGRRDGVIQEREVRPIAERWDRLIEARRDVEHASGRGCRPAASAWSTSYSTVDVGQVAVEERRSPSGTIAILHEPSRITLSEVDRVTKWRHGGQGSGWLEVIGMALQTISKWNQARSHCSPDTIARYTCTSEGERFEGSSKAPRR